VSVPPAVIQYGPEAAEIEERWRSSRRRLHGGPFGRREIHAQHDLSPVSPPTVLLIDDEPAICRAFAQLLERRGLEVLIATAPAPARELIERRHPDAIVIDLHIGRQLDESGESVFGAAVALDPGYARRTLFMTGDISDHARERLAATGRPFLMKPFAADSLLEAVLAMAAGRPIPIPRSTVVSVGPRQAGRGRVA
jgi:CheY-like chemotaxis protein